MLPRAILHSSRHFSMLDSIYHVLLARHAYGQAAPKMFINSAKKLNINKNIEYNMDMVLLKTSLMNLSSMLDEAEFIKKEASQTILPSCMLTLIKSIINPEQLKTSITSLIDLPAKSPLELKYKATILGMTRQYKDALEVIDSMQEADMVGHHMEYNKFVYTAQLKGISEADGIMARYSNSGNKIIWGYYRSTQLSINDSPSYIKTIIDASHPIISAQLYMNLHHMIPPMTQYDNKILYLNKAHELCPEIEADKEMLSLYFQFNKIDELYSHWMKVKDRFPSDEDYLLTVIEANIYWHVLGDKANAARCYERAKLLNPKESEHFDKQIKMLNKNNK